MKYWLLKQLVDEYNCTYFDEEYDAEFVMSFNGTRLCSEWKPLKVNFLYKSRKKGDCPSLQLVPFFSKKAIEALKDIMGDDVEYLTVTGEASRFTIVNVIKLVDALDRENSDLLYFSNGNIMTVDKIVIDSKRLEDGHIFKLVEFPRTDIIVSDEFKKRVEERGLKGFDFKEVEVS